jgi:S1-C subfamily serine protease
MTGLWELTREQVLQRVLPSAVQIVIEQDGQRLRTGSGVAIAARPAAGRTDCVVLTSGHTFARLTRPAEVYVLFGRYGGPGTKVPAGVLAQRETDDLDLALLRAQSDDCLPTALGQPPQLGEPVWIVAFPWGRNMTLVGGTVSQLNLDQPGDREMSPRFMVDASVSYGASGGGVFDARRGRLVGLVEGYRTARVSFTGDATPRYIDVPVPGGTYVVPLVDIRRFLAGTAYASLLVEDPSGVSPGE